MAMGGEFMQKLVGIALICWSIIAIGLISGNKTCDMIAEGIGAIIFMAILICVFCVPIIGCLAMGTLFIFGQWK